MNNFYLGSMQNIPRNAPNTRGKYVQINNFVYLGHAVNKVTRRLHTEILTQFNMAYHVVLNEE